MTRDDPRVRPMKESAMRIRVFLGLNLRDCRLERNDGHSSPSDGPECRKANESLFASARGGNKNSISKNAEVKTRVGAAGNKLKIERTTGCNCVRAHVRARARAQRWQEKSKD